MTTWNHRVARRTVEGETCYGIHEVYYSDNGEIRFWTLDPVDPFGETVDELRADLARMYGATYKDVIDLDELEADK